jgi:hypothetical protein
MKRTHEIPNVRTLGEEIANDGLLTEHDAAKLLAIAPATLKYYRCVCPKAGPPYIRIGDGRGMIRYSFRALLSYLKRRTVRAKAKVGSF